MNNAKIGIFIFRRDLRLNDNLGLLNLSKNVDIIIPIFILDKTQIKYSNLNKHYYSQNAVQFMCESLIDLDNQLTKHGSKLKLFYHNDPAFVVKHLILWIKQTFNTIDTNIYVGYNADFSQFAINRDNKINKICKKYNTNVITYSDDYTMLELEKLTKDDGLGFKQFGAFYKNAKKHKIAKPLKIKTKYLNKKIIVPNEFDLQNIKRFYKSNPHLAQNGGRTNAIKRISKIKQQSNYNKLSNFLNYLTSKISAYLNFGCLSIREVYWLFVSKLSKSNNLFRQLYWRDFYLCALRTLPDGNKYTHMDKRYEKIKWRKSDKSVHDDWKRLLDSQTGFLIVDAAINEMKITGFMHNRARIIVGAFWTKYLQINIFDPVYGSQVGYSKYLVDAIGPSQNKLNHQWITEFDYAGKKYSPSIAPISGRPINPSNSVIKKFDPNCLYIKKYLPHLKHIDSKELINWNVQVAKKHNMIHPAPMFDAKKQYKKWINLCKHVSGKQ